MKIQLLLCGASLALSLAACSDDSISIDDFESKLVDAACKNEVTCQGAPDLATCKASIQVKSRTLETIVAKVKSKVIKYDGGKAQACIDSIQSGSCGFDGFHSTTENPCDKVFTGTVAANGACTVDQECSGTSYCKATDMNCDSSAMCCPGTCTAIPAEVAVGGDCTNAPCVKTAYCDSTTNKCTALVTSAGAACTDLDSCGGAMYCDMTCIQPAARGATCDPMALLPCSDFRDYCDATTMKCTQNVAVGQACDGANGAACIGYADCTNMSCVAKKGAGGACMTDSDCLGSLACMTTCTLPPAETACARLETEPTAPTLSPTARMRSTTATQRWLKTSL